MRPCGAPYVPRLSFKPFYAAISEGSHVAIGISSKAIDREDVCLQTLFLFLFFPHTPRFPDSPFPGTQAPRAMILPVALHTFLVRKRTFITLSGTYKLIKLV